MKIAAPPAEPSLANKPVPATTSELTFLDRLVHWRARFGIGRMHFRVAPGLYQLGSPDETSPVFVLEILVSHRSSKEFARVSQCSDKIIRGAYLDGVGDSRRTMLASVPCAEQVIRQAHRL